MVQLIKYLLDNRVSLFVICYLLIMVPIIGIMVIHNDEEK
jgi:hypothetical protein